VNPLSLNLLPSVQFISHAGENILIMKLQIRHRDARLRHGITRKIQMRILLRVLDITEHGSEIDDLLLAAVG